MYMVKHPLYTHLGCAVQTHVGALSKLNILAKTYFRITLKAGDTLMSLEPRKFGKHDLVGISTTWGGGNYQCN